MGKRSMSDEPDPFRVWHWWPFLDASIYIGPSAIRIATCPGRFGNGSREEGPELDEFLFGVCLEPDVARVTDKGEWHALILLLASGNVGTNK